MKTKCYVCGKKGDNGQEPCIVYYEDETGKIIKKETVSDIICSNECSIAFDKDMEKQIKELDKGKL